MKTRKETISISQIILLLAVCVCGFTGCRDDSDNNASLDDNGLKVETPVLMGVVEKGPFAQGSQVTLRELDAALQPTGKSLTTQTTDDFGAFRFETAVSQDCQYVEVEASGCFFDALQERQTTAPVTLYALTEVGNRVGVNVNLLTHLEAGRVKKLVGDSLTFAAAKRQAEKELLACFAITDEVSAPEDISLTAGDRNTAMLLAVSTIMLYKKQNDELSKFLDTFAADFADNGTIDDASTRELIREGQNNAHPSYVAYTLRNFYAAKGVAVELDDFSRYIDFNGDGIIDGTDEEYIAEPPVDPVTEETFFKTKEDLMTVLNYSYLKGTEVESWLLQLENMRTDPQTVHSITPQSGTLDKAFSGAYYIINLLNRVVDNVPAMKKKDASFTDEEMDAVMAEAKSLRAFLHYNLAMLWGDVFLATESVTGDETDYPHQSPQREVYQSAYADICEVIDKLPASYSAKPEAGARFTRDAAQMLKAELELTLGLKQEARKTLGGVDEAVSFGFDAEGQSVPVYTPHHLTLYQKEANGNSDGLETAWAAMTASRYGYWAALKRLGKAQEVTGCYDHELLLPFPYQELWHNPNLKQNPGY